MRTRSAPGVVALYLLDAVLFVLVLGAYAVVVPGARSTWGAFAAGQLARLEYVDALGQRTAIAFSGWKRNPAFAAGTFAYVPAKGVDVIGN